MEWQNLLPTIGLFCIIGAILVIGFLILVSTFIPIAGIFGGLGWLLTKRSKDAKSMLAAAQSWHSTRGEIITSRVEVSGGEYTRVHYRVVYQYTVGGIDYQGNQVRAGDTHYASYTTKQTYDIVDRYPVGAEVTVYYDPTNPVISALER
jgi:hypothetical protein